MPTYLKGRQNTGVIEQAERKVDIPPELFWLRPDNAPLVKLTSGRNAKGLPIKRRIAINPEFKVLEKEPHDVWDAINQVGFLAADLTVDVDDGTKFNVGDVVRIDGADTVQVTSISVNTLTITRSIGPTAAADAADNTLLYIIGNAHEENSVVPNIHMIKNRVRVNFTQIFRKTFGLSRTLANSEMYQGKKRPELRREAFLEFERQIERAFLFGEPGEDLTGGPNGAPIRFTGGVKHFIDVGGGHVTTAAPSFSRTQFAAFIRPSFEFGSEEKVFLCDPLIIEMLDFWKEQNLRFRTEDMLYKLKVAVWETGQGTLQVIRDREFRFAFEGFGFILDVPNLVYRFLGNSDMALMMDIVKDGQDGFTDQYLAEVGLQLTLPETHSYLENITTFV